MRSLLTPAVIVWSMLVLVYTMIYFVRVRRKFSAVQRVTGYRNVLVLLLASLICIAASLAVVSLSSH
jgi:hypothetical protein